MWPPDRFDVDARVRRETLVSVAAHLGIDLAEYDARIRTFIPDYEEMLGAGAAALRGRARTIVDLGIGTGALAGRCLDRVPRARVIGIDSDRDILRMAASRLGARATLVAGSFLRTAIPRCDAVVASFALHHVRTRAAKLTLYRRIRRALASRGLLVIVDCQPSSDRTRAAADLEAWRAHLRRAYSSSEADAIFQSWSKEDVYVPLEGEMALLERAGFRVRVPWRRGPFAVLLGRRIACRSA